MDDHPIVHVLDVEVLEGTLVRLRFDDGETVERDLRSLLWGPVFEAIARDPARFAEVSVDEFGVVAWPNGADIDPGLLRYDDLWDSRPWR